MSIKMRQAARPTRVARMGGREWLVLALASLLVMLIYSNTLEAPFVFDDTMNISTNPYIRLTALTWAGVTRAAFQSFASYRPVANISFAMNYYFHKYNVVGYHVINIMIHIATGILLYMFVKITLSMPALQTSDVTSGWIAGFTALLWLVHPLQTQSVTYIVQRMNSLAAMFYILSLLLYAKARLSTGQRQRWLLFVGCVLAGILALGSKEVALTLPFYVVLYEWYFVQDLRFSWFKRYGLGFAGGMVLLALGAYAYVSTDTLNRLIYAYSGFDFTAWERVLSEFRVVLVYLRLWLLPHPSQLNLDYDFPPSRSLLDPPTTLLALGVILALMGLALYLAPKERLLSFCILWFFGNLVLESSIVALELLFEHRTYLPSMLLSLLAVTCVFRSIKLQWLRVAVLCPVALLYCVWTYERNSVWANEIALWSDCVAKSPYKARPHSNLADALARQGRIEEAVRHYTEALRLNPTYARAHNNLGDVLERQGRVEEAVHHYTEALRFIPNFAEAHNNLGNALMRQGRVEAAMHHYTEALRLTPDVAEIHNNLGSALARQGRVEEAVRHYTEALRLNPHYPQAYNNLGNALARQGRVEEAVRYYTEALRLNPNYTLARSNLERVLRQMGPSAGPARSDSKP